MQSEETVTSSSPELLRDMCLTGLQCTHNHLEHFGLGGHGLEVVDMFVGLSTVTRGAYLL